MFYRSILNFQIAEIMYEAIFLDCVYIKHRINFSFLHLIVEKYIRKSKYFSVCAVWKIANYILMEPVSQIVCHTTYFKNMVHRTKHFSYTYHIAVSTSKIHEH